MELTIVGCSPAVQNPGGACSSYLVSHGERQILIDCGHGAVGVLRSVTDLDRLSAIVISHVHPDHIFDLVPLTYGFKFGRLTAIPLAIPPGAYDVLAGLQRAVGLSDTFFAETFNLQTYDPERPLQVAGFDIDFALTRHYIPAYAMRLSVPGEPGALVYSADTGWTERVLALLRDASLALVEASVPRYIKADDPDGHLTPELTGKLAREAGVKRLIVTHYAESLADLTRGEAEKAFGAPIELARERIVFTI